MSHRPRRPVEPHSLGPHHERPHIPHHGAHNAGGFGPFHPYQSSQNTSHSYCYGHPTFGHSFSPYSASNAAHRQSPLDSRQGAVPQPFQAASQPDGAVTKAEVADDHPWPSSEDSSGKLSKHVATSGRPVDIMGSQNPRASDVNGGIASKDPALKLSSTSSSHDALNQSTAADGSGWNGHPASPASCHNSPHIPPVPPQTPTTGDSRPRRIFAPGIDSNNAIVGQRARIWGHKSPATSPSPKRADPTPAGFAEQAEQTEKENDLRRGVETVPPVSPDQGIIEAAATSGEDLELPSRPDSTQAIPPPHVALVSDEESTDESDALPTPRLQAEKTVKPSTQTSIVDADGAEADDEADDGANPWAAEDVDSAMIEPITSPSRPPNARGRRQTRGLGRGRALHLPLQGHLHSRPDWWRPPPHPVFSPKFSDRRLFIHFPVPIREDLIRPAILQHFSRYGTVRGAFHHDSTGSAADKGVVIFEDPMSVEKCFADPRCGQFSFQSNAMVARTEMEVQLERRHPLAMTRILFVQITGSRIEGRPRSASPLRRGKRNNDAASIASSRAVDKVPYPQQPLPHQITVFAKPVLMRGTNKLRYFPTVLDPHAAWSSVARRLAAETGHEPEVIADVDASPRVPERDIIPRLCDMLAEVVDIIPPNVPGGGWLIRVSGPHDTRRIFEELARVPGIYARWYHPGDGQLEASPAETMRPLPLSPLGRLEHEIQAPVMRATSSSHFVPPVLPIEPTQSMPMSTLSSDSSAPSIGNHAFPSGPAMPPFQHPFLRREIVYMYKDGRQVDREEQGNSVVFLDKRAVHVSRLVKEKETKATLLERFKHYGAIAHVEYNPASVNNTYATARVLFHERDAAVRAKAGEDGHVSFGSVIKVVERIVQDRDVEVSHVYLDPYNNIISPAAAEQYSPPRPAETLFPPQSMPTLPPPMLPMGPYPQPPPPMAPYQSSPAHNMQPAPGYMMMPLYYGVPMPPPSPYPSSGPPTSMPIPSAPPQAPCAPTAPAYPPTSTQAADMALNGIIPGIQALGIYGPAPVWVPYQPYYPFAPTSHAQPPIVQHRSGGLSPPPSPPHGPNVDSNPLRQIPPEVSQARLPTPPPANDEHEGALPVSSPPAKLSSGSPDQPANALRATKFEWHQGVYRPVYDPDDLKAWYESRGMQPTELESTGERGAEQKEGEDQPVKAAATRRRATISGGSSDGGETIKTGNRELSLVPVPVPFSPQPASQPPVADTVKFVNVYPRVRPISPHAPKPFYIRSPKPSDKDDLERIKQRRARELEAQGYVLPLTPKSPVERMILPPMSASASDTAQTIQPKISKRKKVPSLEDGDGQVQASRERRRVPLQPPAEVYPDTEHIKAGSEGSVEDLPFGGW